MSLADLPEVLIASLTSFLNYSDTCKLMQTSKKIYKIIKEYGKNKPNVEYLEFGPSKGEMVCTAKYDRIGHSSKRYSFKNVNSGEEPAIILRKVLQECHFAKQLTFREWVINSALVKVLEEMKHKFRLLEFKEGKSELTATEFVLFCKNFKQTKFEEVQFKEEYWTDDVLVEIIPYADIERRGIPEIRTMVDRITDQTLRALIRDDGVQKFFVIGNIRNSFTVKGICEVLELADRRGIEDLDWNLGILKRIQSAEADRCFNDYDGDWGVYKCTESEKTSRVSYKLTAVQYKRVLQDPDDSDYGWDDDQTTVFFAVLKR